MGDEKKDGAAPEVVQEAVETKPSSDEMKPEDTAATPDAAPAPDAPAATESDKADSGQDGDEKAG